MNLSLLIYCLFCITIQQYIACTVLADFYRWIESFPNYDFLEVPNSCRAVSWQPITTALSLSIT